MLRTYAKRIRRFGMSNQKIILDDDREPAGSYLAAGEGEEGEQEEEEGEEEEEEEQDEDEKDA
jgi:hypothetical protein